MSRNLITILAVVAVAGFAGCAAVARAETAHITQTSAAPPNTAAISPFQTWTPDDPHYRFFPGDEVEIIVRSAPELSRTLRIAPDGRLTLPMIDPVMAADLTAADLASAIGEGYRTILRDPSIDVIARGFASQQVFVAGEVRTPGVLDLTAPIDAYQAIARSGGFLTTARTQDVLILRRLPTGEARVYRADLSRDAFVRGLPEIGPLQRFDVIYVPRTPIAEIGLFMQHYVREALPVNFSLFYDLRGENRR
jgi:protein involved in polysaccharide export with SLBB domain